MTLAGCGDDLAVSDPGFLEQMLLVGGDNRLLPGSPAKARIDSLSANAEAVAKPMPELAPVTRAT